MAQIFPHQLVIKILNFEGQNIFEIYCQVLHSLELLLWGSIVNLSHKLNYLIVVIFHGIESNVYKIA